MQLFDGDLKALREEKEQERRFWEEWEKTRIIRKCKRCGERYSYGYDEIDPRLCSECR